MTWVQRMKIACYFTGRSTFGGAERRIGRVMNGVAERDIIVEFVFTLFEPLEQVIEAYVKAIGGHCHIKFTGFNHGREVFKYLLKEKFDVVFYVGAYRKMLPFFLGALVAGSRKVLLQVSTGPSVGQFDSMLERIEFQIVAKNSEQIDCLYPSTTEIFKKKYKKQIVTTTPCPATDLTLFHPKEKEKTIAFISRWVKGKNVELFVKSILKIEGVLYDCGYKILLCGKSNDGIIEKTIEDIIQKAKHPDIFIRPGYVNSTDILPQAEIFMSLQLINNYPSQSLLEAIACGCYIIASDEGDTKLLVKPDFGVCCALTEESISKCILNYLEKKQEEKTKIIEKARLFSEETFNMDKSICHYRNIIDNLMRRD